MTALGQALLESLEQAAAHAEGAPNDVAVRAVPVTDARAVRRSLGMSQIEFATAYRIPLPTLKNWEQGRRHPDAPAAAYLLAISRIPKALSEALARDD